MVCAMARALTTQLIPVLTTGITRAVGVVMETVNTTLIKVGNNRNVRLGLTSIRSITAVLQQYVWTIQAVHIHLPSLKNGMDVALRVLKIWPPEAS